jgi:alkanesulfonate monooxygenase SsuD/methylene tetrahydromethanopterin reductase-like flavin-dependent oxidoreductase (luciferase family)
MRLYWTASVVNPLFNANKLKLGVFGTNCSQGCTATTAEGTFETTWPNTLEVARIADEAGMEALVPIARWKGFGGPTDFNGAAFETYTWAAGLAAATTQIALFSTSHVLTTHPIVAAKQAATIDHISNGRFGLNVVCGWYQHEFEMFNYSLSDHDGLYLYANEWLQIVRRLWTETAEWDFQGRFFQVQHGYSLPKPIQQPVPVMNAGSSAVGARFAARQADLCFTAISAHDEAAGQAKVAELRRLAGNESGRDIQVWTSCAIVCRPTEREAMDFARHYIVDKGDWEAVSNIARGRYPARAPAPDEPLRSPGWGSYLIVGNPAQVAERMLHLSDLGLDGVVLSWVNYPEEMRYWNAEVMPLLEEAGLRSAAASPAGARSSSADHWS